MKKITIGKKEYEQAENAEDLGIRRYTDFQFYMIFIQTGVFAPDLIDTIRGFIQGFDNESKSEMLITLHNYFTGLSNVTDKKDSYQMAFAVITFDEGEDWKGRFDETKAKEKLEKWADEGLTQGIVEESVRNFIKASSAHFVTSLANNLMTENSVES